MDDFLQMDWNPALDDVIDTKFVDTERTQRESSMYKLLRGRFIDPFADLHEEQHHLVTSDIMAKVANETREQKQTTSRNIVPVENMKPQEETADPKTRPYVPGLKPQCWFPRPSELNATQQALCLKVHLKFYGSERPEITAADKEELQTYMSLSPTITKEQQEFLEYAREHWDASEFKVIEEEFINEQWKKKIKRVNDLPRYYTEVGNVPFVSPKEIGLNFQSSCLEMGILPVTYLPTLTKRFILTEPATKMNQRFFSAATNAASQKNVIFKTPVSEDPNCDILAKDHEADLVISSGGLNCLAINIDPQNTNTWILPVVVKRINEKNVVYIDKPLPPTGLTVLQKNAWINKYRLKSFTTHPYHKNVIRLDEQADKEITQFQIFRNFQSPDDENGQETSEDVIDQAKKDDEEKNDENKDSSKSEVQNDRFLRPPVGHNLFYRLFAIGSSGEPQNELLKNRIEKVYKLLVRTKIDGATVAKDDVQLKLVAPKMEHQLHLGAEAVTLEEAAKQWMALTFRPNTSLARVRIDTTTSEVIQIESRSAISVNNEIKRLYKLKTETALTLLYNVAETMTNMMPGRYLLRHSVRSGGFANIYKETAGPGKNAFDLQTVYWEDEFRTFPNPPWPAIDQGVVTPSMKCFNRMPAMFNPHRQLNNDDKNNLGHKKNRGKKMKKPNGDANAVRKSLRRKEPCNT